MGSNLSVGSIKIKFTWRRVMSKYMYNTIHKFCTDSLLEDLYGKVPLCSDTDSLSLHVTIKCVKVCDHLLLAAGSGVAWTCSLLGSMLRSLDGYC